MHTRVIGKLAALAIGATTLLSTSSASAADAVAKEGWSVAGLLGFGLNSYGFGIGARGGYALSNHLYLGGTLIANIGFSGYGAGVTTGGEVGYEIEAGPVIVRPYGGLGLTYVSYGGGNYCYLGVCGNIGGGGGGTFFEFWAGGTVLYPIKEGPWFVGGDLRILDIPSVYTNNFGFAVMGTGGYHF